MNSIQFLNAILKHSWLIDQDFASAHGAIISSFLNHNTEFSIDASITRFPFTIQPGQIAASYYNSDDRFNNAPEKSVAVIPIKGVLMKDDMRCGPNGTATIGQYVQEADRNPNIAAIVLKIDSPGGTVDGTEALANIINSVKKPVVAFVDGLMASAAFWIGSAAQEIICSTDTDTIGSVGVVSRFADWQPVWEAKGVKFHTIAASTSPYKNKISDELREGNYENYIKDVLDPLDEKFMGVIKNRFPKCEDQHLTGAVFYSRDVMGVFVDSMGTIEHAIARAYALSEQENSISNSNLNTRSMLQFTKLNAVLGIESLESVDESVSLNEGQLLLIETALDQNDQAVANAKTETETERDQSNTLLVAAENNLTNAVAAFDAIDPSVASAEGPTAKAEAIRTLLAARPGVAVAGILDNLDSTSQEPVDADWETINNLPHNKDVDNNS